MAYSYCVVGMVPSVTITLIFPADSRLLDGVLRSSKGDVLSVMKPHIHYFALSETGTVKTAGRPFKIQHSHTAPRLPKSFHP